MKRKYARNGEKPKSYKCTNKKCNWEGKESEKKTSSIDECMNELICPNCGKNEFYGILN